MARPLIDALAMEWKPEEFHDTFQEKVAALITAKQAGETVEKAEPPAKATGAVDLMEALRASVEKAKSPKASGEKAAAPGVKQAQKAARAKKRTNPAPKKTELDGLSKAELYEKATTAGITGRSHMTRDELQEAITRDRAHQKA
ncbi:hypothetical protein [Streptomyces sp. KS 21]|uniref:hypothetical protein n=1 Tax=Streptomyces sp. KS 21 TaxID=2485150 RepID=UPI0010627EB0|nr:hypothetical protein [Streptomyces sp. KS 21]